MADIIIVVDDEKEIADLIALYLENDGSCGKTAPNHGAGSAAGNGGDAGESGSGVIKSFRSDFIFKS